ncbi:remorin-like [Juglans microcarpa x Juglans regia]|uniref:remorin-like n=1 Tax=Juglans microcarpa x Juglans regia TaxID=2249226 RepID=UPI001B7F4929|nr:remorin-like [Juglans microcarpa x Juglans regia]
MARPRDKKNFADIGVIGGNYVPIFPPTGRWNAVEEAKDHIGKENSQQLARQLPAINGEPFQGDGDFIPKAPPSEGTGHEETQNLIPLERGKQPDFPQPAMAGDSDYKTKHSSDGGNGHEETQYGAADAIAHTSSMGSTDRGVALAQINLEKRVALSKAWEQSEKKKTENRASKKLSTLESWAHSKKAAAEAEITKIQEKYAAELKNKIAEIERAKEEKRALVEASQKEEFIKLEQMAERFRATGHKPKKLLRSFSCLNFCDKY